MALTVAAPARAPAPPASADTPAHAPCPRCQTACAAGARFCAQCGQALPRRAPDTRAPLAAPPPGAAWGAIKPATILFADIADSTQRVAQLSPEQAMQQLQPAIARMVRLVEQHGGTVLRTLGDGVMALFGVPRALEQHAEQACLAALRMQQAFGPLAARAPGEQSGPRLALRIGLHTGKVASDPTEAGDRRGGGAHGVAIHLASRVAAQAEPGQVLLTAETRRLLRPGLLAARPAGTWHLKGIVPPVPLFRLLLDARTPRLPTPADTFVGRARELAELTQALAHAHAGQGQILTVSGEPGMGKTRLCTEFARQCQAQGLRLLWVQTHPLSHTQPQRPARELLRALCLGPGMAPETAPATGLDPPTAAQLRQQVRAALAGAGRTDPVDAAWLLALLGLRAQDDDGDDGGDAAPPPVATGTRLPDTVAALLRAAGDVPTLIVVEDLHWLDAASWPVLSAVAHALPGTRTLLLAAHRLGFTPPWGTLAHARTLTLGALPAPALQALVAERLAGLADPTGPAGDSAAPEWVQRVAERSQGNPFFAEELARHLCHLRVSGTDTARWQGELPDGIDALISARIDALPPEAQRVLRTAAVIGKQVDVAVLARVLRLPPGALAAGLRSLRAAGLLTRQHPVAGYPPGLVFAHPLVQEAAYAGQLSATRQRLHACVAHVMAQRPPASAVDHAALLAHHRRQAQPTEAER